MVYFEWERFKKHDRKKYGELAAKLLEEIMEEEMNGYCFKYPKEKAAALLNLPVKDFNKLVDYLASVGAVCVAGNAIVSNPHRTRFKKLIARQF
jgi:hypothetical protein